MKEEEKSRGELLRELEDLREKITCLEEREREQDLKRVEHADYYKHIEDVVEERTAEIRIVNRQLQNEIEQRRRAEEALQTVAGQWRDTLDSISDAVWLMDLDHNIIRCNKAAARMFKKDYHAIIGKKCFDLVHGGSGPVEGCPVFRMYKSRRKETVHSRSGDRWLDVTATPLRDRAGRITGVVHVVTDITKERRLREEIKASRKRLVNMLESITDGFFAVDRECRFIYVNRRAEHFLRKTSEELAGTSVGSAFPGDFGTAVSEGCEEALKKGRATVFEAFSSSPPGWIEARVYPSTGGLAVYFHYVAEPKEGSASKG